MRTLSLLSSVVLSKAEKWARYLSLPLLYNALYYFLDFMAHQIIHHCKNGKPVFLPPSSAGRRKTLFLLIFLLILANIKSTSLKVKHVCLPCVFSAVLEFFVSLSLVLEVTSDVISEILFMIHSSNLLQTY